MLNFMLYSILFAIASNYMYKLYVITYYNHYIIQITDLKWMAWLELNIKQNRIKILKILKFQCMQQFGPL